MARLHIRLSDSADRDIIAWLESQDSKSAAVKSAIRAVMDGTPYNDPATIDLAAIRAILETVLDERLSGMTVLTPGQAAQGEDPKAAVKLDAMF